MAGVCGWIGDFRSGDDGRLAIEAMTRALVGADGQESGSSCAGGAAMGACSWPGAADVSRRDGLLAAIEGAPRWADAALAKIAAEKGHANALAEGWRAHGRGLLDRLRGSFSLAVAEPQSGRALLAVDRFGIGALKYAAVPGGLVFGSVIDAVRAHPAVETAVSPQSLLFYLCFFVIPAPRTVWRGIAKLMAGQYVERDPGGRLATGFYWKAPYDVVQEAGEDKLAARMRQRLDEAVRRAVDGRSNAETAGFLSGGLDSSSVCGYLAGAFDGPVKAFTVGFAEQKYDETPFARLAAERFGLDHRIVRLTEADVVGFMQRQVEAYDEPFGNSSAIPAYYCALNAREAGVRLMVAGDGGDEIFAGNERYIPARLDERYRRFPRLLRRAGVSPLLKAAAALGGAGLRSRVVGRVDYMDAPMPDRMLFHSWMASTGPASVFDDAVLGALDADGPLRWLREVWNGASGGDELQRFMHLDLQITLADNDLRKVTRMCELAGCEVRFPMLDEALVEFAAGIPSATLLRDGILRGFYKRAMADFLPRGILEKAKHGFGMPFGEWLHSNPTLHETARDCLGSLAGRGLLRPSFLSGLAERWERGETSAAAGAVWDLTVLELWLRRHVADGTF
jgi:asparagine synthase (glutamine-hydrolysing)